MDFLALSREARETERTERQQLQQRQREFAAEQEKSKAEAKYAQRMRWAAMLSIALAVSATSAAFYGYQASLRAREGALMAEVSRSDAEKAKALAQASESRARESEPQASEARQIAISNESRALAAEALAAGLLGHYTDSVKLALAAWPRSASDQRPMLSQTIDALGQGLSGPLEITPRLQHEDSVYSAAFSPDGARVVTASRTRPRGCGMRRPGRRSANPCSTRIRSVARRSAPTARGW